MEPAQNLLPLEGGGQEVGVTDVAFTLPLIPSHRGRGDSGARIVSSSPLARPRQAY